MLKAATFCMIACFSMTTNGQIPDKVFQKQIKLEASTIRVDSLLLILTRHTGVQFSFNSTRIPRSGILAIPSGKLSFLQWLEYLKVQSGLHHRVVGNHIILIDQGKTQRTPIKKKVTGKAEKMNSTNQRYALSANQDTIAASHFRMVDYNRPFTQKIVRTNLWEEKRAESGMVAADKRFFPMFIDTQSQDMRQRGARFFQLREDTVQKTSTIDHSEQNPDYQTVMPLTKIDLGLQGVGFSFERKLARNSIIDFSIGAGGGYAITGLEFTYKLNIDAPDLYVSVNPRFYYNRSKRLSRGKNMRMNAGNYFGIRLKYVTDAFSENFVVWDVLLFNVHWGFQRPLGGRWLFNGHIGPGYGFTAHILHLNHWYPSVELKFAYVFGKRSRLD